HTTLVIVSMQQTPQHGSQPARTIPVRRMRSASPASIRSTMRCTTSRGVKCSPGFSLRASLNFRISSSKIVPIVGLSTFEALEHPEEEPCLIELADGVVEV